MKNTNKTSKMFAFNFTTSDSKTVSLSLPSKFEGIFNRMSTTTDSHNSVRELSCFCEEYLELDLKERAKFQDIINSGLIDWKLNKISDLRILVGTIGEFEIIENAANITELGKRLVEFDNIFNNDKTSRNFKEIGLAFCKKTDGKFNKNGNYYYINKIKAL